MKIKNEGFTLIELLIAVGILLIITTQIAGYFKSVQNLVREMKTERNLYHAAHAALHVIERDIKLAFKRPNEKKEPGSKDDPQFQFGGLANKGTLWPTFLLGEKDKLDFTSFSNIRLYENSKESEHCRIFYTLKQDPNNSDFFQLARKKLKYLDEETTEKETEEILLSKIKSFEFKYFDEEDSDTPWVEKWDSESDKRNDTFPKAIKVEFELTDKPLKKVKINTTFTLLYAQEDPLEPVEEETKPPPTTPPATPPGGGSKPPGGP